MGSPPAPADVDLPLVRGWYRVPHRLHQPGHSPPCKSRGQGEGDGHSGRSRRRAGTSLEAVVNRKPDPCGYRWGPWGWGGVRGHRCRCGYPPPVRRLRPLPGRHSSDLRPPPRNPGGPSLRNGAGMDALQSQRGGGPSTAWPGEGPFPLTGRSGGGADGPFHRSAHRGRPLCEEPAGGPKGGAGLRSGAQTPHERLVGQSRLLSGAGAGVHHGSPGPVGAGPRGAGRDDGQQDALSSAELLDFHRPRHRLRRGGLVGRPQHGGPRLLHRNGDPRDRRESHRQAGPAVHPEGGHGEPVLCRTDVAGPESPGEDPPLT